ncbi:MAG: trehalose-phosphatase, partial [Chloroflexota bacterium]|nr:trehalose-phosphatase [Chloroflexota bacterium]
DYDGTLTPIVSRPEDAHFPEKTRELLRSLARHRLFLVGVISGRALSDLKQRVGIGGIIYAGNHGLEIEGPGISLVNPLAEEMRPVFHLMHQVLSKALSTVRGVIVEDKGLTLSVHYRMVPDDSSDQVKSIFERVVATARSLGRVRVTSGKKVYEIRPAVDWDKGKAIALLLDRYGRRKATEELLAVFMGDDLTDEDGFKVVNSQEGISIFVGEEPQSSAAQYYLKSPLEVEGFLSMLLSSKVVSHESVA